MPERRTHDYLRNGLTTLFAAFDVATGEVVGALLAGELGRHRGHGLVPSRPPLARERWVTGVSW